MKNLIALVLFSACAAFVLPAAAADNPQQDKMKACNSQATGKKGDDRKKFMSDCLSADKKSDNKMGACNTKSKGMKGDERKKFMSDCMKGTS